MQLDKVCHNVQVEPHLIRLENEHFHLRSTTTDDEARLDIKAGGFWRRGQNAFFDVRITHVNSESNKNLPVEEIFRRNEAEKKRTYLERIVDVEHATFTPLVFGTNGGISCLWNIILDRFSPHLLSCFSFTLFSR